MFFYGHIFGPLNPHHTSKRFLTAVAKLRNHGGMEDLETITISIIPEYVTKPIIMVYYMMPRLALI